MTKELRQAILNAYRTKICNHAQLIDPDQKFTWEALFIGLAIGMGATVEEAINPSLYDEAFMLEAS